MVLLYHGSYHRLRRSCCYDCFCKSDIGIDLLYTILIVGMIPAIVVSYYLEVVKIREKETSTHFLYKLEHLPELSKEELAELSEKIKKFQKKQ